MKKFLIFFQVSLMFICFPACSYALPSKSDTKVLTLSVLHHSIQYALASIQKQTNVSFTADKDIEYRRINIFCTKCPLNTLLPAIAYATGFTWNKTATGYNLSRSPARYALEQERLHESEMDHDATEIQLEQVTTTPLMQYIDGPSDGSAFYQFLKLMTPNQITRLIHQGMHDLDVISTDGGSNYYSHFVAARRISTLPLALQKEISFETQMSKRDLEGAWVGAVGGQEVMELAVLPLGSDLFLLTRGEVSRGVVPARNYNGNTPPEVKALLQTASVQLDGAITESLVHKVITFPKGTNTDSLPVMLKILSKQTGIPIVCDDYLRSQMPLYPDSPGIWKYPFMQLLRIFAKGFAKKVVWYKGALMLHTATLGMDLRYEPPDQLLHTLWKQNSAHLPMSFADIRAIGKLTKQQVTELCDSSMELKSRNIHINITDTVFSYPWLHLLGMLSERELKLAESPGGLSVKEMSPAYLALYRRREGVGLPVDMKGHRPAPGLYITVGSIMLQANRAVHIMLVPKSKDNPVTACTFNLASPNVPLGQPGAQ